LNIAREGALLPAILPFTLRMTTVFGAFAVTRPAVGVTTINLSGTIDSFSPSILIASARRIVWKPSQ